MIRTSVALCFGAAAALPAQQVRDSAGVRIVENARPLRTAARVWRVDQKPFVEISGDKTGDLNLIMGARRMRDGRIAVASQASNSVRFYDSTGKYLSAFGRTGGGPGEFTQLMSITLLRGDTIVAYSPLSVFTPDGKHVRRVPRAEFGSAIPWPMAFVEDGTGIGTNWDEIMNRRIAGSGERVDTATVFIIPPDRSRADSVGRMPLMRRHSTSDPRDWREPVFGARFSIVGGRDMFYAGFQENPVIRVYDRTGKLRRLQSRPAINRPVSDSAINAYKAQLAKTTSVNDGPVKIELSAEQIARMNADVRFAKYYPEFVNLHVDQQSNLWVQRFNDGQRVTCGGMPCVNTFHKPGSWDVFDGEGRWVTTVVTPADFTPTDIGATYIGGVWRDSDDVEHVRYYRLIKP